MLIRRVAVENARSFLGRAELSLDGPISIIIGPNGGGKTNLLDTVVIALRRFLKSPNYFAHQPSPENQELYVQRHNDVMNNMLLEKHSSGRELPQKIEIEIEVTQRDLESMKTLQDDVEVMLPRLANYSGHQVRLAAGWDVHGLKPGQRFVFEVVNGSLKHGFEKPQEDFYQFIHNFEEFSFLRSRLGFSDLTSPVVYLPINRSAHGFQSSVQLAGYNDVEHKRQVDGTYSRQSFPLITLAVGRLATKYRLLQEDESGNFKEKFYSDPALVELGELLGSLGYSWELKCISPTANQYDISLKKQGSEFMVGSASSGERELLNYLFAIYSLNIRDSIIIIDEPELHLHPRWQIILLEIFGKLSSTTGNQFLLATHSPAFVSPQSIRYISRVFSREQKSNIVRLSGSELPNSKHLFNIINSQNNERIFFADKVVLVEGISDRVFFEALIKRLEIKPSGKVVEIVNIGGKGFFKSYEKILSACKIDYAVIADLDYVEQVGGAELKSLFRLNANEVKKDVIDNVGSLDGIALVQNIDQALATGSWDDARAVWDYIKSRRRQLIPNLEGGAREKLDEFIEGLRSEGTFILSKGAIEQYLPAGLRQKDLDKLIEFVAEDDFWEKIDASSKEELELIIRSAVS
ncbi:AAA family ATPase [Pseudomonas sp. BN515]|uniref:AAA family ATPase n=1 Tax=Pseudomonas sp. BN515 TaxID=2567892 RepID=UPI0024570CF6|nr:AAA family ATPase [Pseudomonas sp. BN515]MDH4870989.1 chromosome segregation protein SMC [Pseudomonas sp. BN515]